MSKMGRPRVEGKKFHLNMDPDLSRRLDEYVKFANVGPMKTTKTDVINWAIRKFLDEAEKNLPKGG